MHVEEVGVRFLTFCSAHVVGPGTEEKGKVSILCMQNAHLLLFNPAKSYKLSISLNLSIIAGVSHN